MGIQDIEIISKLEDNYYYSSLIHLDFFKLFYMKTDASDFALEVVLLHMGEERRLDLVAFYFIKFSSAKINYEIYNKKTSCKNGFILKMAPSIKKSFTFGHCIH